MHADLTDAIFALGPHVRYVAYGEGQEISTNERPGIQAASEATSDRFEELLVNPTLLTLTRQRGELDCGGLDFVVVGYGNFNQLVMPTRAGHVSVALEKDADVAAAVEDVGRLLARHGLAAA